MSNMRFITGKYLEEKLKKGHRLQYFLNVTGSSEDELFEYLDNNFSSKAAKAYKKRMKSKGSPQKRSKKNTKMSEEVELEVMESIEIVSVPEKTDLELLLEKEEILSSELCGEEAKHAQIVSHRAVLKNRLQEQHHQIKELTEQILQLQADFESAVADWNSIGDEMKELSAQIAKKRTQLEEIRSEIVSLKKISIFVYSNGEIEFENQGSFNPTVDSSKVNDIFGNLIQNEAAECLTIKNIKQLAKLLAIVEKLKAEGLKFVIEFDENTMKEVFDVSQTHMNRT